MNLYVFLLNPINLGFTYIEVISIQIDEAILDLFNRVRNQKVEKSEIVGSATTAAAGGVRPTVTSAGGYDARIAARQQQS